MPTPITPWDDVISSYAGPDLAEDPEFLAVVASIIKAESGFRLDAVGDQGASIGPYQMHERGAGAGMSPQQRMDINIASSKMVPQYAQAFREGRAQGLSGPQLAVYVGGRVQRPAPGNEQHYGTAYAAITGGNYQVPYQVPTGLPRVGTGGLKDSGVSLLGAGSPSSEWLRTLFGGSMAETKRKGTDRKSGDEPLVSAIGPLLARILALLQSGAGTVGPRLGSAADAGLAGIGGLGSRLAGLNISGAGLGAPTLDSLASGFAGELPAGLRALLSNPNLYGGLAAGGAASSLMSAQGPGGGVPPLPPDAGPANAGPGGATGVAPSRVSPAGGAAHPGNLTAAQTAQAQATAQQAGGGLAGGAGIPAGAWQDPAVMLLPMQDLVRRAALQGGLPASALTAPAHRRALGYATDLAEMAALANAGGIPNTEIVQQLLPALLKQGPRAADQLYAQMAGQPADPAAAMLQAKQGIMQGQGQVGPPALSPQEQIMAQEMQAAGGGSPAQWAFRARPELLTALASVMSAGNLGRQLSLQPYAENQLAQFQAFAPENELQNQTTLDMLNAIMAVMRQGQSRR